MDDCPAKLKIIPDHFQIPTSSIESSQSRQLSTSEEPGIDQTLSLGPPPICGLEENSGELSC